MTRSQAEDCDDDPRCVWIRLETAPTLCADSSADEHRLMAVGGFYFGVESCTQAPLCYNAPQGEIGSLLAWLLVATEPANSSSSSPRPWIKVLIL